MARRWNFPDSIVNGLDHSADPLTSKPFSRLAAVVHVAELLAEMAPESADVIDDLPADVLTKLQIDLNWMRKRMPMMDVMADTSTLQ
jgi:HD-like signal output (HDOD) protein